MHIYNIKGDGIYIMGKACESYRILHLNFVLLLVISNFREDRYPLNLPNKQNQVHDYCDL